MNEKMRSHVMGLIMGQFSSPLPISQKEPVAYLYNGVRLPKLPEWDREMYPYAIINYSYIYSDDKAYCLIVSTREFTKAVAPSQYVDAYGKGGFFCKYALDYPSGKSGWNLYTNRTSSTDTYNFYSPLWSNFDICNKGSDTVWLAASEPIPVYE